MDKDLLLSPRVTSETDTIDIPNVGTVTVRGLSRWEMLMANKGVKEGDVLTIERRMLHFAMVDPALTESDVEAWQKASPANEINPVMQRINELSGIAQGSSKSDLPGDGDD